MSEWLGNQSRPNNNIRKLLKERFEKANPRRKLTGEETKGLSKISGRQLRRAIRQQL